MFIKNRKEQLAKNQDKKHRMLLHWWCNIIKSKGKVFNAIENAKTHRVNEAKEKNNMTKETITR